MATSCPIGLDVDQLRREISFIYARVAEDPSGDFHFHRGAEYAAVLLGYDANELAAIPATMTASFAGVGNPHCVAPIEPGETVIDIGCGAGTDLMLAARRVGPTGKAVGVDVTPAMAERARAGAKAMGLDQVEIRVGDALELPIESGSVDVIISNGVLNLTPDKERAYAEAFRVLKPGGRFQLADIIVATELSANIRNDIDLWTG
ncbi:MAG: methyltransferase domain-containing protein [Myxococcota bacterium]|nr:methyltransferase domain-containing protein [Deltaproteobacteria bacterium]MDQ3341583.1 methyltransferase domain-containing protein [Myxococcota bacterium]